MNNIRALQLARRLADQIYPYGTNTWRERHIADLREMILGHYLIIRFREVSKLPSIIGDIDGLTHLEVVGVGLNDPDMYLPDSLQVLTLDMNDLEEFPTRLPRGIMRVSINSNNIRKVPHLSTYRSLTSLSMLGNPIRHVWSLPPGMVRRGKDRYEWWIPDHRS